jgi:ABC-type antimicrobial peptide transport system permease subunit
MKTNVPLISSLRKPFRSLLLLVLFGLISFAFMTKAVGFILVQRETGVLGSYYRSIGILKNIKDPQAGEISAGIALIETSPYFAYGDQRERVSGVMAETYNQNIIDSNATSLMEALPPEYWPNTHTYDLWFTGDLIDKEEVKTWAKLPEDQKTIGYYLKFNIDTLLAAYPEYAKQGSTVALLFLFEGHESAIPSIQAMQVGRRYFIRGRDDHNQAIDLSWVNEHFAYLEIKPLDDGKFWYIPLAEGASIDLSDPVLSPFKNEIDVLNENLHTLNIMATADQSAMPKMQEASRFYYLTEGRWLNHQDDLAGAKVIVLPEPFANLRGFKVGDEITFTFRPLTDTYFGLIRDGVDSLNWRSYPTYQDTFKIVGLYNDTNNWAFFAYIPTSSLRPGFASTTQNQFRYEEYNFVLDSSRHEAEFIQAYKAPLQALGISLTFLKNNGPAFWAAVDPIRRSSSADLLVFGLLMVVALILAVFLYVIARKRDYAILRALGVPKKQASGQLLLPIFLLGGLGILLGGLPAWNYALTQAKASLSSLPLPAGVSPSADLSPLILAGLCMAIFFILALFSWLGVYMLAHKPVFELLQGETSQNKVNQKRKRTNAIRQPVLSLSSSLPGTLDLPGSTRQGPAANRVDLAARRKYTPSSLSRYVLHHVLRSRLKSFLTLAVALGFMLASGWIRQTMERSRLEVERLYDTTVVEADIMLADPSSSTGDMPGGGTGFVYLKTIDSVLNSGFVKSSVLEADTAWVKIKNLVSRDVFPGNFPVYAYDSPEAFNSGLADPGSLVFASGWDMDLFAKPLTIEEIRKDGLPALFPASMLEMLQLKVGQTIQITVQSSSTYPCVIVGQYSGGRSTTSHSNIIPWKNGAINPILIPLSALEAMDGSQTKFTVAHFSLDPKRNRELPQFRADMEKVMQDMGGKLNFVIWDEELRIVVAQLDKNLSLLKVLYPVVIGVSVLIGAGLCFLLLLQTTREAAILRVLGTTRTAVRLALILEPLFLSILGVLLGLGISRLLWMSSDLVFAVPLLVSAGLYLAGVLAGSVTGALSVTNKKPIELLQVKE